jgi:hypothetical protein
MTKDEYTKGAPLDSYYHRPRRRARVLPSWLTLFVANGLDWIEPCRLDRRINSED